MTVRGIGLSLAMDASGTMREGPLVVPVVSDELQHLIQNALSELSVTTVSNNSHPVLKSRLRKSPSPTILSKKQLPCGIISLSAHKKVMPKSARTHGRTGIFLTAHIRNGRKHMRRKSSRSRLSPRPQNSRAWARFGLTHSLSAATQACQGTVTGNPQPIFARTGNEFWALQVSFVEAENCCR
jgi:hypothetical protein